MENTFVRLGMLVLAAGFGFVLGTLTPQAGAQGKNRVFELRTYYAHEGKLNDLHARFRNHTTKLFEKHGMTNVGYWVPQEGPQAGNTLIYILAHQSRQAASKSWEAFRNDPEWIKARDASERNGKLVAKVESVFLDPVDYSPMK
jgi:hypothetical protein